MLLADHWMPYSQKYNNTNPLAHLQQKHCSTVPTHKHFLCVTQHEQEGLDNRKTEKVSLWSDRQNIDLIYRKLSSLLKNNI